VDQEGRLTTIQRPSWGGTDVGFLPFPVPLT